MQKAENRFTRAVRDEAVGVVDTDGSRRVFLGDVPLGRKCQAPGPRCAEDDHDFYIDEYPRIPSRDKPKKNRTYVDKVCRKCTRRVPVK